MIIPSTLNFLIVGLMMVIFGFFWRMLAAKLSEKGSAIGDAMAVAL